MVVNQCLLLILQPTILYEEDEKNEKIIYVSWDDDIADGNIINKWLYTAIR